MRFGGLQLAFEAWLPAHIGFGSIYAFQSEQMSHGQLPFEGIYNHIFLYSVAMLSSFYCHATQKRGVGATMAVALLKNESI